MKTLLFLAPMLFLSSCAQVDSISDEDLWKDIQIGSSAATKAAVRLAIKENPTKADVIKKDMLLASSLIKTNIMPIFSGATSADLAMSSVTSALNALEGKISPMVANSIKLGLSFAASAVTLPQNPAEKLDVRTKGAILAFLTGTSMALDAAFAQDLAAPEK